MSNPDYRLIDIKLDERTILWRNADIEQERRVAIFAGDHVGVGQHVAVRADDEARADALARARPHAGLAGKARHRHAEAAQEVVEGVVGHGVLGRRALRGALHHADVDHGRADLLDEVTEVGQAEAVGRHHRGGRGGRLRHGGGHEGRLRKCRGQRDGDGAEGKDLFHFRFTRSRGKG